MREREADTLIRTRLREAHSPEALAEIYSMPWGTDGDEATAPDHRLRIDATIAVARWFEDVESVADLSCGDSAITCALGAERTVLGDFGPGYELTGPIEETIHKIDSVDLFICSETLEHLDDPDAVLRSIREKTRCLVATSPIGEWNPVHNPEHYWGWGTGAFDRMLRDAGFEPIVLSVVETPPPFLYDFQILGCR
jgi:hypothetical protein